MPSKSQLSLFEQLAPIAGWPKPKILCWAVKHNQKETHTIQVQPPKFCFSLWFLYQSKPLCVLLVTLSTYGLSVSLLQFVLISTYHHCMYYVIFRLLMHLFLNHSLWLSIININVILFTLTVWKKYLFCYFIYRIGVGIFCKVCYSVWTRFIIHIIKATCLLYQKVPKLCTTGKTKFYSLLKIHISI